MEVKLEFTEVFKRGYMITDISIEILLKCKNINFSHNLWSYPIIRREYVVKYIVDNIVDINMVEYSYESTTLLSNIIGSNDLSNTTESIVYVLNNGYIDNNTFTCTNYYKCSHFLDRYKWLVKYLTKVSLDRFTRFYNIEKYYDTCTSILLIIKVYQKLSNDGHNRWLPSNIIKHLVLPFVYQ